jgi:hypothetical protein
MGACVRACVDACLEETIDVFPREVINDPLCIAVCCFECRDSLRVQGGTCALKLGKHGPSTGLNDVIT